MIPILIISSPIEALARAQKYSPIDLTKPHPDLLQIEPGKSIGIDKIREITRFLSVPPFKSKIKVVGIFKAHLLTPPAQNALLKILEESPACQFILITHSQDLLLPTIISRCQTATFPPTLPTLSDNETDQINKLYQQIIKLAPADRLIVADNYKLNRDQAITFCHQLIIYLRQSLLNHPHLNLTSNLHLTQKVIDHLHQNAHVQLNLDHLFLHLK